MLQLFPAQLYNWLEEIVTENEGDLGLIHPVLPNQVCYCRLCFRYTSTKLA